MNIWVVGLLFFASLAHAADRIVRPDRLNFEQLSLHEVASPEEKKAFFSSLVARYKNLVASKTQDEIRARFCRINRVDVFAIALGLVYYMQYPRASIDQSPTICAIPLGALLQPIASRLLASQESSFCSLDLTLIFNRCRYARGDDSRDKRIYASGVLQPFLDAILYMVEPLLGASVVALDLCGNFFIGPLPSALATFTHLQKLDLACNQFSGSIPSWIARLENLTHLNLCRNELNGSLPAGLGALSNLEALKVSTNRFHGKIPAALWQLKKLKSLCLAGNNFSGQLSPAIENLADLEVLKLSDNNFSGKLPCSVHTLNKLKTFYFDNSGLEV